MAKEVAAFIKLQIKGGAANPSPPVGPALGSKGVNIMDFCIETIVLAIVGHTLGHRTIHLLAHTPKQRYHSLRIIHPSVGLHNRLSRQTHRWARCVL